MLLLKSSIFCLSNFGHLQTPERKDGIYMKIIKTFYLYNPFHFLKVYLVRVEDAGLTALETDVSIYIHETEKQGQK